MNDLPVTLDLAAFITYFKEHAIDHGFHIHGERHFIETYSVRQSWEVDLHPEEACDGPLDLHMALNVSPEVLLAFQSEFNQDNPQPTLRIPLLFNWDLPPMAKPPDLLVLATDLAGIGGPDLPIEVSAVDTFGALSDSVTRRLSLVGQLEISMSEVISDPEQLCDPLERCREVSGYLLSNADEWIADAWNGE